MTRTDAEPFLLAQIKELERDARRYRWLKSKIVKTGGGTDDEFIKMLPYWDNAYSLDEHIDAAIQKEKP